MKVKVTSKTIKIDNETINKIRCCKCRGTTNLRYGADPYAKELLGDDTPVWECVSCRNERARNI